MRAKLNDFSRMKTKVEVLPSQSAMVASIRSYKFVVQYALDGVKVLKAEDFGSLPDDLLELRAFDDKSELHVVKVGEELRGRVRIDGDGAFCDVFDEEHYLWGERVSKREDAYVLREDRGTQVTIPAVAFNGLQEPDGQSRVTVRVRNYLDDEVESPVTGDPRFAFCDYRLVCFNVREVERRGKG